MADNLLTRISPFKTKIKYLDDEGRPKTVVRTGKKKSFGISAGGRDKQTLATYWKYYKGEGTVWAAINSIAFNTVMVGYNIESDDPESRKLVEQWCRKVNLDDIMLDIMRYSLVMGDAFVEIIQNRKGEITRLKNVDPKTMEIEDDKYGTIQNYVQKIGTSEEIKIDKEKICHFKLFSEPDSQYGISLVGANKDAIDKMIRSDEAISNATIRHGTTKTVFTVGTEKDGQIPPPEVLTKIEAEVEDIDEKNEFIVPWNVSVDTIDEKGVPGVEQYFKYFQSKVVIGLLCPEEALGLGTGGTEACNDEKTQVLTRDGWKHYWELKNDDEIATFNSKSGEIEYHKTIDPVNKYVYDHDGPMIKIKSLKNDMLVTPNHRMFANKNPTSTKEDWKMIEAQELFNTGSKWAFKSKVNPTRSNKDIAKDQIDLMKFIGYHISEGSINKDSPYCRLSQKKEESASRIKKLLKELPYNYKESYSNEKGYEWHCYNHELWNYLKQFGKNCYERKIPRYIMDYDAEVLEHLLFAAIDGDGTPIKEYGWDYGTTSEQLANDIQEIAIKCGYRAQIGFSNDTRDNRLGMYRVYISKNPTGYTCIEDRNVSQIYYKGKVYSLNVPNHIYLTRRNGKVSIHGNTSKVKALLYERTIRSFQTKMARTIENQLINVLLEENGKDPNTVFIEFKGVTDEDEAVKAKWIGNFIRGFRSSKYKPLTINEMRKIMGFKQIDVDEANTIIFEGFEDEDKQVDEEDNEEDTTDEEDSTDEENNKKEDEENEEE